MQTEEQFAPFLARRLWPPSEGERSTRLPGWLLTFLRYVYAVVRDVVEGRLALHAASLVYTTILSLVPLAALGFSVLKGFGVHYRFEPLLETLLAPLGDQAAEISGRLMAFVENVNVGVLGAVGLALLFYTAISTVQKVEDAFNEIWHVRETRPMARKFTDYLSVLLIGPVLMFSAIALGGTVIASEPVQQLGEYRPIAVLLEIVGRLLPVVLLACTFAFLYKFLTYASVNVAAAIAGGVVAALIWLVAGWAFATFVGGTTSYTAIYSAFAALILFLLWLNVNWLILLIGSSIAFYHQHPAYMPLSPGPVMLSNRCRERLALATMQVIGEAQYAGEPPLTTTALRRRLRVPEETIQRILSALAGAGLVTTTKGEPPGWVALRPFDVTETKVLMEAVRRAGEQHGLELSLIAAAPSVKDAEARINGGIDKALEGLRLKDLVTDGGSKADKEGAPQAAGRGPARDTKAPPRHRTAHG
jgi:membrane protein